MSCLETYIRDMVIFTENIGVKIVDNAGVFHIEYRVCNVLYAVLAHMVKCKKCRLGLGVWIGIESY